MSDIATEYSLHLTAFMRSMKCINVIIPRMHSWTSNFRTGHFSLPAHGRTRFALAQRLVAEGALVAVWS